MLCVVMDVVVAELDRVHARVAGRFARSEPRVRAREYVSGLVAGVARENGWTRAAPGGEGRRGGRRRVRCRRTGCSGCCVGRIGTSTVSVMICGTMWWSTLVTAVVC